MRHWLRFSVMLLAAAVVVPQGHAAPKKLIETGWDMPDTQRLRDNLAQMEQQPFDGVVVQAVGKPGPLSVAFSDKVWRREDCRGH